MPQKYMFSADNHRNSQDDNLDDVSNMLTIGDVHPLREQKLQQLKRMGVGSASEDDQGHSEEESVSFIDLQHNNLKLPEKKGILKKQHDYGGLMLGDGKESWGDGAQAEDVLAQAEAGINQLMGQGPGASEVERTLKTLNGYHEDIIKALRNAASHRGTSTPSGSSSALSEELLRRSLQECADSYSGYKRAGSREKVVVEPDDEDDEDEEEDEDQVPSSANPLRIRNLEDLIRQLEHHSRHMSPSGSEDIRMSETEADRHYRQESSSACSESSHQSHRDARFVYGRYRQPTGRLPYPHPHQHGHHHHAAAAAAAAASQQQQPDDESIYESADHDRGAPCGDTPDSESDEFIQAQQQLARWASEDTMGQAGTSSVVGAAVSGGVVVGVPAAVVAGAGGVHRDYLRSPSSSTSEEPPSIARAPAPAPSGPPHPEHATIHRPKRYPEYKH